MKKFLILLSAGTVFAFASCSSTSTCCGSCKGKSESACCGKCDASKGKACCGKCKAN